MSDHQIRLAAFDWLGEQTEQHGDVLPWKLLIAGYMCKGERMPPV